MGIMEAGYEPLRMDQGEHVNRIDDEIISQINSSKFVVADFTGHQGDVYFEAGYTFGIGLPVFWTCQQENKKARTDNCQYGPFVEMAGVEKH
ncbi:MAG: hypothetical protein WBP54_12970 [Pelodictyon phaeoclathratiforme]